MHKHLKQPLIPADHVNTSLSAGIGEIIDVAMAKDRDERYNSTEDMLEDLESVRRSEPPPHAHRSATSLDQLEDLEQKAKTVDILPGQEEPPPPMEVWNHPVVIGLIAGVGVSVLDNVILLVVLLTRS